MSPHSIYNDSLYESRTTPYHPQGNGQTKQMNWTLNWTMIGLDFFNPKITRRELLSTLKSRGDDFFVHDYHGAYTFFSLLKSRGAEFFCTKKSRGIEFFCWKKSRGAELFCFKNHGAQYFFAWKNHGAKSYFALKNHGADTFFDAWKYRLTGPVSPFRNSNEI